MNEYTDPHTAIKAALADRRLTLTALSKEIGSTLPTVSRAVLHSQPVSVRSVWPGIFTALDIEVIYRVKDKPTE